MKENSIKNERSSIEEAVKTMERWVEYEKNNKDKINKADELIYIQETILSDYKRVLKINEVLLKENEELKLKERRRIIGKYGEFEIHNVINRTLSNDYIPVQKAKDKIKELEEELEIMKVDNMYGRYKEYGGKTKWERLFATKYGMHDALQELLEGRNK